MDIYPPSFAQVTDQRIFMVHEGHVTSCMDQICWSYIMHYEYCLDEICCIKITTAFSITLVQHWDFVLKNSVENV